MQEEISKAIHTTAFKMQEYSFWLSSDDPPSFDDVYLLVVRMPHVAGTPQKGGCPYRSADMYENGLPSGFHLVFSITPGKLLA